jgi:Tfp pilus assembly protein PilV
VQSSRLDRADEAGVTLIECVVALLIIATAVIALLGGLGSSIVASDMHRKTVTADAVARSWAEQIQAAPSWVSCAQAGTPYGAATLPNGAAFSATVASVQYGLQNGTFTSDRSQCLASPVNDTVQSMTLVVKANDGRGGARLQIVKRKP